MHWATFIDFDICQQMTPLQKLYSMTLAYFYWFWYLPANDTITKVVLYDTGLLFKVKNENVNISETV